MHFFHCRPLPTNNSPLLPHPSVSLPLISFFILSLFSSDGKRKLRYNPSARSWSFTEGCSDSVSSHKWRSALVSSRSKSANSNNGTTSILGTKRMGDFPSGAQAVKWTSQCSDGLYSAANEGGGSDNAKSGRKRRKASTKKKSEPEKRVKIVGQRDLFMHLLSDNAQLPKEALDLADVSLLPLSSRALRKFFNSALKVTSLPLLLKSISSWKIQPQGHLQLILSLLRSHQAGSTAQSLLPQIKLIIRFIIMSETPSLRSLTYSISRFCPLPVATLLISAISKSHMHTAAGALWISSLVQVHGKKMKKNEVESLKRKTAKLRKELEGLCYVVGGRDKTRRVESKGYYMEKLVL